MKTKNRKASPSVLIVLIVAILLIVSITFAAIFRQTIPITRTLSVSNLKAESVVAFDGVSDMAQYKTEYGVLASVDANAPNYIGKLRASVQYSGRGVGLIRVRLIEEWSTPRYTTKTVEQEVDGETIQVQVKEKTGRTVQPYQISIPYTFSATYSGSGSNQRAWYDNRLNDYCVYYATPVYSTGTSTIPLITGVGNFDVGLMSQKTEVHILVETDVVQVNRYPQYWGLTSLPWTGSSATVHTGVAPADDVSLPAD